MSHQKIDIKKATKVKKVHHTVADVKKISKPQKIKPVATPRRRKV